MSTPKQDRECAIWFKRINAAVKFREPALEEAEDNEALYNNKILSYKDTGYSRSNNMDLNLVYVDTKQSVYNSYSKNPKIFFDNETPEAETAADIYELIVSNLWVKLKLKGLMRDAVKSTKFSGVCGFKTYFNLDKEGSKDRWNDSVFNDEVRVDRVPLKNLLKDPDADSYDTSWWIGHEIEMPLLSIYSKFKLSAEDKLRVEVVKTTGGLIGDKVDDEFKYGQIIEVEDRRNIKIFTLIKGIKNKKFDEKDLDYPQFDTMYDFLMYNDLPDCERVHSDFFFWKKQLKEMGIYRTMIANHAKKGTAKYKSFGEKLTDEQINQLKTAQDSSVVQLSSNQDIVPFQHSSIDPTLLQAEATARQDIQLISKQAPRQSVGESKTATEIKAVEMAAQEVESENSERLDSVMASIASKMAKLMWQNYTVERIIKLSEMTEAEFLGFRNSLSDDVLQGSNKRPFVRVSKENLNPNVTARIQPGSTMKDNEQSRMNKFMGFIDAVSKMGANAALDIEEVVLEAEKIFGVQGMNLLKKKDDPFKESKLLNSGIFVSAKLSEDHEFHIATHEKESNDNYQNALHIQMHKQFQEQIKKAEETQMTIAQSKGFNAAPMLSGSSFVGSGLVNPGPEPQAGQTPGPIPAPGAVNTGGMQ